IRSLSSWTSLLRSVRDGVDDRSAYGADVFVWRLQISTRDDVDHWNLSAGLYTWNGVYRAATPVGFNRSLVCRRRGRAGRTHSNYRRLGCPVHSWWQHYWR